MRVAEGSTTRVASCPPFCMLDITGGGSLLSRSPQKPKIQMTQMSGIERKTEFGEKLKRRKRLRKHC